MNQAKHCCQLNTQGFAVAAAFTMGIVYILCLIFVYLWPDFAMQLLGWLVHLVNVDKYASDVQVSLKGGLIGLIEVLLYTYVISWVVAWLHNKFSE